MTSSLRRVALPLALLALSATASAAPAAAQAASPLNFSINGLGTVSAPLQIVVLLTLISFVPAALVIMTSFTRIAIVFHFLRMALGTQDMPSNQMMVGLTLFLTAFIMAPVAERINEVALQPAIAGCTASALMRSATGAMMNAVRNSVSPTSIWFEGISCVPSACLKKWKTMAILVKDVMMTSAAGTNDSNVNRRTICSGADTVPTPSI